MANYFNIILDTTPPNVTISAPDYTIKSLDIAITISSNETLSNEYEVYFIDSSNTRHNFTLDYQGNKLIGTINLSNCSVGNGTLHVNVKDEVANPSHASSTIKVVGGQKLILETNVKTFNVDIFINKRDVNVSINTMTIENSVQEDVN